MQIRASSFCLALALGFAALPAQAIPILDQSTGLANTGHLGQAIVTVQSIQQGVTTGIAGALAQVDVQIYKSDGATGDVTFSIIALSGTTLGSTLFSTVIPIATIPLFTGQVVPWTPVDVIGSGLIFGIGDTFAVGLSRTGPEFPPWVIWSTQSLPAPSGFEFAFSTFNNQRVNLYFGTQTYVSAVPEPSTLALLGAGLIGLAWRRRAA